ncbi:MAG: hypothetical protein L0Z55_11370 [Planctomycetes bacterium]|nr:hypothetical protein [Planctomycetota bacterium]
MAEDLDPDTVLNEARRLADAGEYEEALQKHLWYHENAHRIKPSLIGVRLSFALSDWIKLGEKYPKAREALVGIRDRDTNTIADGNGTFRLFQDVVGINHYLKEDAKTVALFKALHEKQPDMAKVCYYAARDRLVAAREYQLCSHYMRDPDRSFDRIQSARALGLEVEENGQAVVKGTADAVFLTRTCQLIAILAGAGRQKEAEKVRERALAIRDDPTFRAALDEALKASQQEGE